jgi:hypothetical protein
MVSNDRKRKTPRLLTKERDTRRRGWQESQKKAKVAKRPLIIITTTKHQPSPSTP